MRTREKPEKIAAGVAHVQPRRRVVVHQEAPQGADHDQQDRRREELPRPRPAHTQKRLAAISPTLAASPSMLSSMLNELVEPDDPEHRHRAAQERDE